MDAPPILASEPPRLRHLPRPPRPGRWLIGMRWHDLLFAHWPVDPAVLAPLLPRTDPPLELDTFEGQAWIGVVPFRMSGIHLRGWPSVPGAASFPELNVRTYVRAGGLPGVWFFSLDAASRLAVRAARVGFHLPYFDADMTTVNDGDAVEYASARIHRGAVPGRCMVRYRPIGPVFRAPPGSREHWLTERYRLFSADRRGRLFRGEILHEAWPLQRATAEFGVLDLTAPLSLTLDPKGADLLFARRMMVRAWSLLPAGPR